MATRFYLPSSGAGAVSPTYSAEWENTSIASRLGTVTSTSGTTMTTVSLSGDTNSTDQDILYRQYISAPINAQTISAQTLKFQIRGVEASAQNNQVSAIGVRVVSNDGVTVRGTVLAVTRDNVEFSSSVLTNRQFTATTSSVSAQSNDRIVIEIGTGGAPSGPNDHDASLRIGDVAASDLTEDDTSTTDLNPWVEFTNTISFAGEAQSATGTPSLMSISAILYSPTVKISNNISATASLLTSTLTPYSATVSITNSSSGNIIIVNKKFYSTSTVEDYFIDWGNPITNNLKIFILPNTHGALFEMITGEKGSVVGDKYDVYGSRGGKGTRFNGNGSVWFENKPRIRVSGSNKSDGCNITVACYITRAGTNVQYARPFCKTDLNGASTPFIDYGFSTNDTGSNQNLVTANSNTPFGIEQAQADVGDLTVPTLLLMTRSHTELKLYAKGKFQATKTVNSIERVAYDSTTTGRLIIGGASSAGLSVPWKGDIYWCAVWSRLLEPTEIEYLDKNPYCFLKRKNRRIIFSVPSAIGGGQSVTATPSLQTSTATTYSPSIVITNISSKTTTPSLVTLTATPYAATSVQGVNLSQTTTPSLQTATATTFSPSVLISENRSQTITPSLVTSTATVYSPTVYSYRNRLSTPSLTTSRFNTYNPTVIFGISTDLEGYRWRDDDGSETTASWLVAQDTAITRKRNQNTRLRVLLNASGDPDPSQYQLEFRKQGDTNWAKVPLS